jgi:tetratricopeptide (TPR) repeat protein
MRTFLADGEKATQLAKKLPPGDPLALLRGGDRAEQAGKPAEAADLYAKAIAAAPADWAHRGQALGDEVMALSEAKAWDRCVQTALGAIGDDHSVGPLTAAQVAYGNCAGELPDGEAKTKAVSTLEAWMWKAATDPAAPLSADDRGDALGDVREGRNGRGDEAGADEAAKKQLEILDAAAAAAPDALAASTFNAARAKALLHLGRGEEAAAMLEKSEKALPGVADPPMRLARVYAQLGRTADAVAALDRAIPLASSKIRVSLQSMKSDLLEKDGKHAEACKALSAAMSTLKELPDTSKDAETKAGLEQKLAACPATSR